MERPYVFCHMYVSLDGKIMGNYMEAPGNEDADRLFYHEAFESDGSYPNQGWLSGRTTTDDNFTFYKEPELNQDVPEVPAGDYIVPTDLKKYYISIDPHGRLAWDSNVLHYNDTTAAVLEVLTEDTSNAYKDFLRRKNISYIIAEDEKLDAALALKKLKDLFKMKTVMLGGGGVLNWSFIQEGLCDEISLVVAPSADGATDTPTLFQAKPGLSDTTPVTFTLKDVQTVGNAVWLRYLVNKEGVK
ncbi:RibD family protein [Xylocopilactobacillus apis]|uniref:5-amino-6-(5-phosphoribosylamino)uracil reductase n=1 Tax=Xylocopilactobacillus apis TaxID=2932183 RepID=A0AAU9CWP4_9LACO|nr:RibD family protein [Xylocopilactobacillus apis]BDR56856.1 5-amino-6-(5-phosphoribosylamino)uracil reductase [Xylocopilactobacillus apis]